MIARGRSLNVISQRLYRYAIPANLSQPTSLLPQSSFHTSNIFFKIMKKNNTKIPKKVAKDELVDKINLDEESFEVNSNSPVANFLKKGGSKAGKKGKG